MASTLKLLGQSAPAAATPADLYTVPASTNTTVSSIVVCNRGATIATFDISVADAGAATENKQYLYYQLSIAPKDTFVSTIGISLEATDKIRVNATTADLSFNIFGVEVA